MIIKAIKIFSFFIILTSCTKVSVSNDESLKFIKFLPDKSNEMKEKIYKAHNGDIKSQFELANFYYIGKKDKESPYDKRALYYYRLASEAGDIRAQLNLSKMYYNSYGTKKDSRKACYWSYVAFYNGLKEAKIYLSMIEKSENSKICHKEKLRARLFKVRSVDYVYLMKEYKIATISHDIKL